MIRAKRTLILLLALSLFLVGCGYNGVTTTTGASPSATSVAGTPTVVTRLTPVTPGATSTTTAPPQGTPGQGVIVQISASRYGPHDAIMVTIFNHTTQTIFFRNHQTECTVVLLQLQAGSIWQSVAPCKLMIVTKLFSLDASKSLNLSLRPPPAGWSAGTYRVAFHYGSKTPVSPTASLNVFSPLFQVS